MAKETHMTTRAARRARLRGLDADLASGRGRSGQITPRVSRIRVIAFAATVVVVLGIGLYLAGSDFLGQRGTSTTAGALPVRLSMAGFDPKVITVKAGQSVNLDFWNTDNAMHLDGGGVHTFIMDSQNINVKIPAEARQSFAFTAPMSPGDYDFYCNTCCGGKQSPTMHGTLRVTA
jgi:cytochrome c oxidase subunit II